MHDFTMHICVSLLLTSADQGLTNRKPLSMESGFTRPEAGLTEEVTAMDYS
jgi:hypothetical protein